jgi:hypothetical protein
MIIERCLMKDPSERFATASDVTRVLNSYMDDPRKAILRLRSMRHGRIALIEPDTLRRSVLATFLESTGLYVHRFSSAQEARDEFGEEAIRALFVTGRISDQELEVLADGVRAADPRNPTPIVLLGGPSPKGRSLPRETLPVPEPLPVNRLGKILQIMGLMDEPTD